MLHTPFYDPYKSYDENYDRGPFGAFADGKVYKQKGKPNHDYHGHKVFLPFGIPPGPLINSNFVKAAFEKGFDIAVYKTVRSDIYPCHPLPNVVAIELEGDLTLELMKHSVASKEGYGEPLSITNSFGVPSKKATEWQKDVKRALSFAGPGQVMVLSFMGTVREGQTEQEFIDDHKKVAEQSFATGAPILEVNLSCPNVGNEGLICYDLRMTEKICKAVRSTIGKTPLIMKIGYFESDEDLTRIAQIADKYAQAIASINTMPAEVVDEKGNQALPGKNRLKSGVCGHAIKWAGLEMTRRLKKIRVEHKLSYEIDSMGGVTTPDDYFEYKRAGADVVMSATGAMWNPHLAREIKDRVNSSNSPS